MKIVVTATVARTVQAFLGEQLQLLVDRGHEVVVYSHQVESVAPTERVRLEHAPWDRPMRLAQWPTAVLGARRFLTAERPDVLYTHTAIASFITRLAAMTVKGRPCVVYCAHGFDGARAQPTIRRLLARLTERLLSHVTDLLFVMNDEDEQWASSARFYRTVRIPSIGLPLERYSPLALTTPTVRGPHRLLAIAELAPRKRLHLTIDTLAQLDGRFVLTVAGDGPLRKQLGDHAIARGVRDRVTFAGHVNDIRPLLSDSWLVVSTTRQEGLPRGLLESLASGVPVVALTARGVSDLLRAGGGLLIDGDNVTSLAEAITEVADHPEVWMRLRVDAVNNASRHDVEAIAGQVIDAIEEQQLSDRTRMRR